ncbi:MAG: glutamyl-tRNA amidotransferase [Candidatus Saccharibacteria bacterium]|nr:glutamyl-tRNA amidotransferase [Candidatus Saccharibacteria bacterium]
MPIAEEIKKAYKPTIGIECHVQLKTKTKLFAAVGNDARQAPPNTLISHICVGMPGALPVLNEAAIELAVRAAFALGSTPQKFSHFDRKHYFYPDLPKGYQITQYANPIIKGGHVDINVDGETRRIGITRAHLEEDAGKNIHPAGADYSLVDLNRAGTPLLEIVSEPDIHSPAEAKAFARELYLLMKYAGVSDVDLYHGNMRFDVNTSVSKTNEHGTRTEVKNLNSFRSVEGAVAYEIERQIELLEKGEKITQETRGWDEAKQKTVSQRGKEEAEDYRYFPEPDVPPTELNDDYVKNIQENLPIMPETWREKMHDLSINSSSIEALLDRDKEYGLDYLQRIEEGLAIDKDLAGFIAKYIVNDYFNLTDEIKRRTAGAQPAAAYLPTIKQFSEVYNLIKEGNLNSTSASVLLFNSWTQTPGADLVEYAKSKDMLQVSDEGEIENIVRKVLADNPKAAEDVKSGEAKAIGFLVGQVMKESQGKANPGLAQQIVKKILGV